MELIRLNFDYDGIKRKFSSIHYTFNTPLDKTSMDETSPINISLIHTLEEILDEKYRKGFKKKKSEKITSTTIEKRYDYRMHPPIKYLFFEWKSAWVEFSLMMNEKDKPYLMRINLGNTDKQSRMLGIYQTITQLPDLKISDNAQIQINKINSLMQGAYNTKAYLDKS